MIDEKDSFIVKITPPAQSWCSAWSDIPIRFAITALYADSNLPADNISFKMALTSDLFEAEWLGLNADSGYETQTNGIQTVTAYIRPKKGITPPAGISSVQIEAIFRDQFDPNASDESYKTTLFMTPPLATLSAPYYPLAADGVIDEGDVVAGVYARIAIPGSESGDNVFLYVDEFPTAYSIQSTNERISIKVPEALLNSGKHYSAYYAADFVNNLSFSPVTDFIVSRDNTSGAITDLPAPVIPVADNNNIINIYDAENPDLRVILNGLYEGEEVWKKAVPNSTYYVYWNSYSKATDTLVASATRKFEGKVIGDGTPYIDNNYNNEFSALKELCSALGEGYVVVTYEMTMAADNKLHASKANTFFVDVVPPGGRKETNVVNDK